MFEGLRDWFERRRALSELRVNEGIGNQAFLKFFSEEIDLTQKEFEEGRRDKALEIWRRMYGEYPDLCLTSEKALNLFVDLRCLDEAEALISDGRQRYPRYRSLYAAALARVAYRRGDLQEALRRYEGVRQRFPQVADGYGIAASCLSDLGRHDEAEAMLERGVRRLPDNFELCMRYAQAAMRRLDWAEGLQRWTVLSKRFRYPPGPLGAARCLREMGRLGEAEKILTEACSQFPANAYPFADLADLSTSTGEFDEAVRRWKMVILRFPSFEVAYKKCAQALGELGRVPEADELLREGMARAPTDLAMKLEYARSAHRREDWPIAKERWAMVRERFPDCAEACEQEKIAMAAMQRQGSFASQV